MIKYLPLKKMDCIALTCTGSVCANKQEVLSCGEYLEKHYGLRSTFGQETYLPLPAKLRAEIFLTHLQNPEIKAIWSLRGGEGSADLIPFLHAHTHLIKRTPPKLLLGFSDFTAILIYFAQKHGWPTLHGVGARQLSLRLVDDESEKVTLEWLLQKNKKIKITGLEPLNYAAFNKKIIKSEIIGGNLSLIHLSLKEEWELNAKGKILLIEEVNEEPYALNRMLKHLQRVGIFDEVRAILFAGCDFPEMDKKSAEAFEHAMRAVLIDFARGVNLPVLYTDHIGHGVKNLPVPFFKPAILVTGDASELSV